MAPIDCCLSLTIFHMECLPLFIAFCNHSGSIRVPQHFRLCWVYKGLHWVVTLSTVRPLKEWCAKRKLCSVGTERPGAVRSVVYRASMVVLGATLMSLTSLKSVKDTVSSEFFFTKTYNL